MLVYQYASWVGLDDLASVAQITCQALQGTSEEAPILNDKVRCWVCCCVCVVCLCVCVCVGVCVCVCVTRQMLLLPAIIWQLR